MALPAQGQKKQNAPASAPRSSQPILRGKQKRYNASHSSSLHAWRRYNQTPSINRGTTTARRMEASRPASYSFTATRSLWSILMDSASQMLHSMWVTFWLTCAQADFGTSEQVCANGLRQQEKFSSPRIARPCLNVA